MPAAFTYYYSNCSPIVGSAGCFLYTDPALTTPVPNGFYSSGGPGGDWYEVSGGSGLVINAGTCAVTTTTGTGATPGTVLFSAVDNASPLFSIGSFSWRQPDILPPWYSNIREEDTVGNPAIISWPYQGRMRADLAWSSTPATYTNMAIGITGLAAGIHKMYLSLYKNNILVQVNTYTNPGYDPGCTSGVPSGNLSANFTITFSNSDFLEFRATVFDGCP